jgi:hypothetical protein
MGKVGRVNGMSSVALLRSSLLTEQHTVLSVAVLKKTWQHGQRMISTSFKACTQAYHDKCVVETDFEG